MSYTRQRWVRLVVALILPALLTVGGPTSTYGQSTPNPRYFSQTGHFIKGAFRSFWERSGGVGIFGYPITEEYIRAADGKLIQYFERARFELRVSGNQAIVDLGLIG